MTATEPEISTEEAALIATIRERFEEDLPRLVYADWLEEHGQVERAKFIRDAIDYPHCEFTNLTRIGPFPLLGLEPLGAVEFPAWKDGEIVNEEHVWGWAETNLIGLAISDHARKLWYAVDRGMIHAIQGPAESWIAHGDAILARHPVRTVQLTTQPELVISQWDDRKTFLQVGEVDPDKPELGPAVPGHGKGVWFERGVDPESNHTIKRVLREMWPGVEFELPSHGPSPLRNTNCRSSLAPLTNSFPPDDPAA